MQARPTEAPREDRAVLHFETDGLEIQPLPIGRSAGLVVGQKVLAIGNPFGLDHTLTQGVVSGLGREVRSPTSRRCDDFS